MNPTMIHIANLYKVTQWLFDEAVKKVKPEDVPVRPQDRANSFLFVAGHMTWTRFSLAKFIGLNEEWPHMSLFEIGAEPKDASVYPPLAEIKQAFDAVSEKINARIPELTEADLAGQPPFKIPNVEESAGGIVSFLSMHEAYHVGQLAYILRLHGGEQLVG